MTNRLNHWKLDSKGLQFLFINHLQIRYIVGDTLLWSHAMRYANISFPLILSKPNPRYFSHT